MATVKVKFRPSTISDREGVIYYQIIHERTARQIPTDYRVYPCEWDSRRGRVIASAKSGRIARISSIKERIRWDMERLNRIMRKFIHEGYPYTSDNIVEEFKRTACQSSLFKFMGNSIGRLKSNGKIRTAETYMATLGSFRKFRKDKDLSLDFLSSKDMEDYQAWLKRRGLSPNTISFYIRILRAVYNRAVEEDIIEDKHPFRRVFTGTEKTVKRALPLPVIKRIRTLDLSLNPELQYAKDMFMLSFMLRGMSFIDMAMLKKSDLRHGYVTYRRRKTGQRLTIEWTEEMQEILDRYPENESDYLLPIITHKRSKERYVYKNKGEKINFSLKKIGEMAEVGLPLTMYVARHSWASIAKAEGIPLSIISEGLGHEKESTTRIYLSTLDTTIVDKANRKILELL